jgi:hypothetical protein
VKYKSSNMGHDKYQTTTCFDAWVPLWGSLLRMTDSPVPKHVRVSGCGIPVVLVEHVMKEI